jgi:hypothetical protein
MTPTLSGVSYIFGSTFVQRQDIIVYKDFGDLQTHSGLLEQIRKYKNMILRCVMHLFAHYVAHPDPNGANPFTHIISVIKTPDTNAGDANVVNSFIEIMQNIAKLSNAPSKLQKFSVNDIYNKKLSELIDHYEYILSQEEILQEPMDKVQYENVNNLKLVTNVNLLL